MKLKLLLYHCLKGIDTSYWGLSFTNCLVKWDWVAIGCSFSSDWHYLCLRLWAPCCNVGRTEKLEAILSKHRSNQVTTHILPSLLGTISRKIPHRSVSLTILCDRGSNPPLCRFSAIEDLEHWRIVVEKITAFQTRKRVSTELKSDPVGQNDLLIQHIKRWKRDSLCMLLTLG